MMWFFRNIKEKISCSKERRKKLEERKKKNIREKGKNKNKNEKNLIFFYSRRAHDEMIWKSGGGLWNTLQNAIDDIDKCVTIIEELKITIADKNKEIAIMKRKILELSSTNNYCISKNNLINISK